MSKSEFAQAYTERMFPDIAAPAGYIAVSYTHLDVYKRQLISYQ